MAVGSVGGLSVDKGGYQNTPSKRRIGRYPQKAKVALMVKNLPANAGDIRDAGSIPGSGKIPWRRAWKLQYSCLENSQGQRSLVGWQRVGHD